MTEPTAQPAAPGPPVERYRALLEVARSFSRAVDLRALTDQTLLRAEEVLRAEACSLLLPDPRTGELVVHSTDPWIASQPEPLRVPPGAGLAGAVFHSKKLLNVKDARHDQRHFTSFSARLGRVSRAVVTAPLLDGDKCLGVLQLINPHGRDHFDRDDEEIAEAFAGLIVNMLLRLDTQQREVERAETRQQLLLAREIQDTFLPPPLSRFPFCQVFHSHSPAQLVGGDFGFVHAAGPDRLLLGLGDVCGKGIPAALTVARVTAIIEALLPQLRDNLGGWINKLNPLIVRELKAGRFISMVFLLADAANSSLQLCVAGQFPPVRFDGKSWCAFPAPNHFPLGFSPATNYVSTEVPLQPGEHWLLLTDGIPEARDAAGREYTLDRFLASLPAGVAAIEALGAGLQSWEQHRGPAPQHDDATLLLLDWRGPQPPLEIRTVCAPEKLPEIRRFIERWAQFAGFGDTVAGQVVMACDEACTNILRHGYQGVPGPVTVTAQTTDTALLVQIADTAPPANPDKIKGRELSDLRPGGLGTVVLEKVFDEVKYTPLDQGNRLALSKLLPERRPSGNLVNS